MTTVDTRFAHIPTPADALDTPSPWVEWDDGVYARGYTCWRGRAAGFEVVVDAWQASDGRPTHREIVYTDCNRGTDLTAARARELAATLIEAATVLERLTAAGDKVQRMSTVTVKTWAEAGEWNRGEPAVVVMRGEAEDGRLTEPGQVVADVPVADYEDRDAVADVLDTLGYRANWDTVTSTPYGVAFDVTARE